MCKDNINCEKCKVKKLSTQLITYDAASKKCIVARDGVMNYLGIEIGAEPSDKIFTVYRSEDTVADLKQVLNKIPLTNEHVEFDEDFKSLGYITKSKIIKTKDNNVNSTLSVECELAIDPEVQKILKDKKELSLGYNSELVSSDDTAYDFEQVNIKPHHLAIVENGRCGDICSFKDSLKNKMEEKTKDEEMTIEQIAELVAKLPEAIKQLSTEELDKILPVLKEIVSNAEVTETEEDKEEVKTEDAEEVKTEDAEEVKTEDKEEKEKLTEDSINKIIDSRLKEHTQVIEKAKQFTTDSLSNLSTFEIQKKVVGLAYGDTKFNDSEIPTLFKYAKKQEAYKHFGDSAETAKGLFVDYKNKKLGSKI